MCGILGYSGLFESEYLTKGIRCIAHRGPDDSGVYIDARADIGLAHARLSILDLSPLGRQPMKTADDQVVVAYNGEIYNCNELRAELISKGFSFRGRSDTEVLINLYLQEGEKLLSRLNGIYAFALWDSRNQTLLLARDGLGVKPLYYSETPKGFLFASELKALLLESSVSRELNFNAIKHYLRLLWCPAPHTPFIGIKKLKPGHALCVRKGKVRREWQHYDIPFDQPISDLSETEAAEEIDAAIRRAVERQMVADVEVGAFLSGGLDSSSIVTFAREHSTKRKLQCFTIGFTDHSWRNEGMVEDLGYAQKVAKHLDVDLHTIYVGPELADQLQTMLYYMDEPQADPAPVNALMISKLARENGIKVLLSGAGGDDIFTGYRRHYALMLEKYWAWLPQTIRDILKSASQKFPKSSPAGRRLAKAFQYANLDGDERFANYFNWNTPNNIKKLLSQEVSRNLDNEDPLLDTLKRLPPETHPLNKMLYLEGKHFLADHNLNYIDKMSMACGVEVRVPLLDTELVSLVTRLPIEFKQRGKIGKWIFKKAMEPYLPHDVIYRPKTGFGAPLRSWLRKELKPTVDDVLSLKTLKNRGIFDPQAVHQLQVDDLAGKVDGTYTLFSIICIELWCRIFLDQPIDKFAYKIS